MPRRQLDRHPLAGSVGASVAAAVGSSVPAAGSASAGERRPDAAAGRSTGWLGASRLRTSALDRRFAIALHQGTSQPQVLRLLNLCSRLADGPLWLSLLVLLPLVGGDAGAACALGVLAVGSVNLLIYWTLKHSTRRPRPFAQCPGIHARARARDVFSFPSGHTLHAVAFALLLSAFYPSLAPLLWAFALLVGAGRVVLGLHYPSDVLVGALIGAATAGLAVAGFAHVGPLALLKS